MSKLPTYLKTQTPCVTVYNLFFTIKMLFRTKKKHIYKNMYHKLQNSRVNNRNSVVCGLFCGRLLQQLEQQQYLQQLKQKWMIIIYKMLICFVFMVTLFFRSIFSSILPCNTSMFLGKMLLVWRKKMWKNVFGVNFP